MAEIFTTSPSLKHLRKQPIGMVQLFDGGYQVEFAPQPDITLQDLAMLLNLAAMLQRPYGEMDWRGYLAEHKLDRHFKVVSEG